MTHIRELQQIEKKKLKHANRLIETHMTQQNAIVQKIIGRQLYLSDLKSKSNQQ